MSDLKFSEAGVEVERLTRPDNFGRWVRAFEAVADEKQIWDLCTGKENILPQPDVDAYLYPRSSRADAAALDPDLLKTKYNIAVEEWKDNNKRVRLAKAVLANWIDPVIRDEIRDLDGPKEAFDYLKSTYKLNDVRALEIAETKLANLTFDIHKPVTVFINQARTLQKDIKDANGHWSDTMVMNKISRTLPKDRFSSFLTSISIVNDAPGAKAMAMNEYTGRLVAAEAVLPLVVQNGKNGKKDRKKENKMRDKCTACNKWGHLEAACWTAHPELQPKKEGMNKNNNKNQNDSNKKGRTANTTQVDVSELERQLANLTALIAQAKNDKEPNN